ncbi:MAG: acylphosphatase [Magnetococcales bacterium]|nr:acylphosphatase [Magnetococcales bacterium]MBF0150825.1 acylphosphatase [Magnetococcales bacterium]MBF0172347.1 acylphosphatase [Magnetococcales bacterium]MBF0629667.1 acylphosphatase [Magnetococcales bacterium]
MNPSEPIICRTLVITGRVQGVRYRASTQKRARELGVSGWVRNRPDGTVEALVSGPGQPVEALIDWCRQGPPGARVVHVGVGECLEPVTGEFEIKR